MAVTTETSDELDAYLGVPTSRINVHQWMGRVRIMHFTFTQGAAAGDANSIARLVKLPAGKVRVLGGMSKIYFSAFGASRVLDVGYDAYVDDNGDDVSADLDALANNINVASAGDSDIDNNTADGTLLLESREGVEIQAQVAGGTIPAAATLKGYIAFVVD